MATITPTGKHADSACNLPERNELPIPAPPNQGTLVEPENTGRAARYKPVLSRTSHHAVKAKSSSPFLWHLVHLPSIFAHSVCAIYHYAGGCLKECAVPIHHGEPHEAYVIIPPRVGDAFKAACVRQKLFRSRANTLPLTFDHATKSFTCSKISSQLVTSLTNSVRSPDSVAAARDPSRTAFQV